MIQIPIALFIVTMLIAVIYSTTITSTARTTEHWGPFNVENFEDDMSSKQKITKKKPPVNAVLKT